MQGKFGMQPKKAAFLVKKPLLLQMETEILLNLFTFLLNSSAFFWKNRASVQKKSCFLLPNCTFLQKKFLSLKKNSAFLRKNLVFP